jgi:hypothetical protein
MAREGLKPVWHTIFFLQESRLLIQDESFQEKKQKKKSNYGVKQWQNTNKGSWIG